MAATESPESDEACVEAIRTHWEGGKNPCSGKGTDAWTLKDVDSAEIQSINETSADQASQELGDDEAYHPKRGSSGPLVSSLHPHIHMGRRRKTHSPGTLYQGNFLQVAIASVIYVHRRTPHPDRILVRREWSFPSKDTPVSSPSRDDFAGYGCRHRQWGESGGVAIGSGE